MKNYRFLILKAIFSLLILTSCSRQPNEVWDDTKTCGRHFTRGFKTLVGYPSTSRQVCSKDEFVCWETPVVYGYQESEYIPMEQEGTPLAMAMPQPRETPGDLNSSIPGIDAFRDPTTLRNLNGIFQNVHFEYNSNLVKGQKNLMIIQNVAEYLKNHPNVYVFIEGHCDERGPAAYNLALGSRRSNGVRAALIQAGVDGERLFTISYGAERPLFLDANEEAWAQNRRVEFKIYQR